MVLWWATNRLMHATFMTLKATPGLAVILLIINFMPGTIAADRTWTGGGGDDFWSSPANWGGTAPAAGDSLFFGGSVRTSPNNDFPPGTSFSGLTINNPAGLFTLRGNGITLGGNILDDMPLVPQTNLMTLLLNTTCTVTAVTNGLLTLGGIISGSGAGLTKAGGGPRRPRLGHRHHRQLACLRHHTLCLSRRGFRSLR